MGFSRQGYWSGLPFPSLGDLPDPGIDPGFTALHADSLFSEPPGNETEQDPVKVKVLIAHLCLTLQPHTCSLPGSSVHGICQARVVE